MQSERTPSAQQRPTAIMSRPLAFPVPISSAAKDILSRMLAISESQRASLEEVEKLLELYEEGDV